MDEHSSENGERACAVTVTASAVVRQEDFWFAYRRGMNRLRFGKIFGSDEEHASRLNIPAGLEGDVYLEALARVIGYRSGFAGDTVEEAGLKIVEFLKEHYTS
ncbi:MAG TPA: hypothetical protein PK036_13135 [Geobacteraceae bacterium]|nr:hypothetical protein [Geobacteraceae bacterium]